MKKFVLETTMTDLVRKVTFGRSKATKFPHFKTGDTIGVHVKVSEGNKERLQLFKGIVIKVQGSGMGKSFCLRKISSGVGVERTFPFASPAIDRIEVFSKGKVRRSRLFYLRKLKGRAARLSSVQVMGNSEASVGPAEDVVSEVVKNQE